MYHTTSDGACLTLLPLNACFIPILWQQIGVACQVTGLITILMKVVHCCSKQQQLLHIVAATQASKAVLASNRLEGCFHASLCHQQCFLTVVPEVSGTLQSLRDSPYPEVATWSSHRAAVQCSASGQWPGCNAIGNAPSQSILPTAGAVAGAMSGGCTHRGICGI